MKTKHEFEKRDDKLVEIREGDELVDNKGQKVEGGFRNETYYPEVTARAMIKELERQIKDQEIQMEARNEHIAKQSKDLTKVDETFYRKFKACQARGAIDKAKEANANQEKQLGELQTQLEKLRAAWPELF